MRTAFGNTLVKDLKSLKENQKAGVYTALIWGLSMKLCVPYLSVYMLGLGLSDTQVGFIATLYTLSQVVWAVLSGPITDKIGRRKATAVFDFAAWGIPALLWSLSFNFWFFAAAAVINGSMQVSLNSFDCLLVEDADKDKIPGIYSLLAIALQIASFCGPVIAVMFSGMSLVPAVRILYIYTAIMVTVKVLACYAFSRETGMGKIRMEETRGKNIFSLALGYGGVLKIIGGSRGTVFAIILTAIVGIVVMINDTFWQIIVSQKLLVPYHFLPFFPILKSAVTVTFLFFIVPRMTKGLLKLPLIAGFIFYFAGQFVLVLVPAGESVKYIILCASLIFDGFGYGILHMLVKTLVTLNINARERARAIAIVNMIVVVFTSPFGWIAGILSDISRNLPFVLNLCLLAAGLLITIVFYRPSPRGRETLKQQ